MRKARAHKCKTASLSRSRAKGGAARGRPRRLVTIYGQVKEARLDLLARNFAATSILAVPKYMNVARDRTVRRVVDQLMWHVYDCTWFIVDRDTLGRMFSKNEPHRRPVSRNCLSLVSKFGLVGKESDQKICVRHYAGKGG